MTSSRTSTWRWPSRRRCICCICTAGGSPRTLRAPPEGCWMPRARAWLPSLLFAALGAEECRGGGPDGRSAALLKLASSSKSSRARSRSPRPNDDGAGRDQPDRAHLATVAGTGSSSGDNTGRFLNFDVLALAGARGTQMKNTERPGSQSKKEERPGTQNETPLWCRFRPGLRRLVRN